MYKWSLWGELNPRSTDNSNQLILRISCSTTKPQRLVIKYIKYKL